MKSTKFVNNPLKLIVSFCGIAITSIYAIKFVNPEFQFMYILCMWGFIFLITFLAYKVVTNNAEVLYSPSDFEDEKNFVNMMKLNKQVGEKK